MTAQPSMRESVKEWLSAPVGQGRKENPEQRPAGPPPLGPAETTATGQVLRQALAVIIALVVCWVAFQTYTWFVTADDALDCSVENAERAMAGEQAIYCPNEYEG